MFTNSEAKIISHHTQSWRSELRGAFSGFIDMFPMWATAGDPISTRLTPRTDVLPVLILPVGTFPLWLLWSQDRNSAHTRAVVSF